MKRASCGLDVCFAQEPCTILKFASDHGYEFVCLPLAHPRFKREFTAKFGNRRGPFTRSDLVLRGSEWSSLVAGKISPYINVDSEFVYTQSKCAFEQELSYGNHLDIPAIIISLKNSKCFNIARLINSNLAGLKPYQVWVEISIMSKSEEALNWRSDSENNYDCTWEWWNTFRTLCRSDKRLGVILEITRNLPEVKELNRWKGEPIKCLVLSTSLFLTNKRGYPVLPKPHQYFLKSLVPLDVQVIIKGNNHHYSLDCYQRYIDHLWQESTVKENLKTENSIQSSMQVVQENLVSKELFDTESQINNQYMKAIYNALIDKVTEHEKNTKIVNIMVVGAGKGSLITSILRTASKANRKVKIFAVERNPHAVVTLHSCQEEFWGPCVEIISEDIRSIRFAKIIDITVSELIDSFGDNKLLPEILNEAQKFLKIGGICIPQSYTSYISPVQCFKMYNDLKSHNNAVYEMAYIITQSNKFYISHCKKLFTFNHPNYDDPIDNCQYKCVTFEAEQNCVLHGFTGFFEAILYKEAKLSTLPNSYTSGLSNLYPLFFPLMEPTQLKAGDKIEVNFWRLVGKSNVWYEWTLTKPIPLPIHNTNGRCSNKSFQ